jgi:hypothetical protein
MPAFRFSRQPGKARETLPVIPAILTGQIAPPVPVGIFLLSLPGNRPILFVPDAAVFS